MISVMELIELKNASLSINKVYIFNQLILILLKSRSTRDKNNASLCASCAHHSNHCVVCVCGQNLQACTISSSYWIQSKHYTVPLIHLSRQWQRSTPHKQYQWSNLHIATHSLPLPNFLIFSPQTAAWLSQAAE